jgi:hypothetical protein
MRPALTAPPGFMDLDGARVPRRVGTKHRNRPIFCCRGHEIRGSYIVEGVGIQPCDTCGCAVYIVSMALGYQLRIPLTADEVRVIRERQWRPGEVFEYVGVELHDRVA